MKAGIACLFASIQTIFHQKTFEPCFLDEDTIQLIRENGFAAIVVEALTQNKLPVPKVLLTDYYQFIRRDTLQMKAIEEIKQTFHHHQIMHVFLKGSILRTLYPQSFLRGMGDLDILVHPEQLDLTHQVLDALGYKNTSNAPNHDSFEKGHDLIIEIHPKLNSEFDERFEGLFGSEWEETYRLIDSTYRFHPEFELAYLIYHLAKHFSNSGIGLRSVLDLGIYYQHHQETFRIDYFVQLLEKAHLLQFGSYVLAFQEVYFAYQFPKLIQALPESKLEVLEEILHWVTMTGIHGKAKAFNISVAGMAFQATKVNSIKKGKFKYILGLLFPPRKQLVVQYPFLEKWGILLPLGWFLRGLRLLFKKTRRSIQRLRSLQVNEETIFEASDLFKKVGL